MFAGKKSAQIREILISESAWEEMTCLFAPSLADAQIEMFEMKKKIEELQAKLNASDELEFRDSVYWRVTPIEGKPNGPFCPKCYEGPGKKLSSMSSVSGHFSFAGKYKCNTCAAYVK